MWVDCDLEVLWVELKQILHLKVDCLDFGPVLDRGSLPYIVNGPISNGAKNKTASFKCNICFDSTHGM